MGRAEAELRHGCGRKRRLGFFWLLLGAGGLLAEGSGAWAQEQMESTRAVSSPDGKRSVSVEWAVPVASGEAVDFSGRMQVRLSDTNGSATRERRIEAPQVRAVQTPIWFGSRWAAFTYNVQKNFNGIVYLDAQDGSALQLEMVAPLRRMGTSGRTEAELTSLDIIEHGTTETILHRNITRGRASVFPLALKSLPPFDGQPFPPAFLEELRGAVASYNRWLAARGATALHLEAGSETFSPDEHHVALLACAEEAASPETTGPATSLIIAPVGAPSSREALESVKLIRLDAAVRLSCATAVTVDSGDAEPAAVMPDLVRYTTRWQDGRTVAVDREVADEEREEIKSEPVYLVSLDGETTRLPAADHAPPAPVPVPEETENDRPTSVGAAGKGAGPAKAAGRREREIPAATTSRRRPATPSPTPAAGSRRSPRESERRIPAVSAPQARPATPTPYSAPPISNLLNRFGGRPAPAPESPQPQSAPPAGSPRPEGSGNRR